MNRAENLRYSSYIFYHRRSRRDVTGVGPEVASDPKYHQKNYVSGVSKKTILCPIKTFYLSENELHILIQRINFRGLFYGTVERFFGTPDS